MLKQFAKVVSFGLWLLDILVTITSFVLAYWLRSKYVTTWDLRGLSPFSDYVLLLIAVLIVWSMLLQHYGAYRSHRSLSAITEILIVWKSVFIGVLFIGSITFVLKFQFVSRTLVVLFVIANLIFLAVERFIVRVLSWYARRKGYNFRNVIVVGTGPVARDICRVISSYQQWGLRIVGIVAEEEQNNETVLDGHQIIGQMPRLEEIIHNYVVDEVIFALPGRKLEDLEDVLLMLEEHGINVRMAATIFPHVIAKIQVEELETIPLLTFTTIPMDALALAVKRIFDVVVSLALITLTSPVMLVAALAIKTTSRGPVLFRQKRCGLNGRIFTLYKFRSMYADAELQRRELETRNEMEGPVFKIKDDPRITTVGKILRKTSIDELPQLWNVLRGDMSIVGPRPPIPQEVGKYERWQRRRLSMRPGITCLWQISGRNRITDFDEWVQLDLQYIDTWSLSLDLKIFLKTIPVVLFQKGAA